VEESGHGLRKFFSHIQGAAEKRAITKPQ